MVSILFCRIVCQQKNKIKFLIFTAAYSKGVQLLTVPPGECCQMHRLSPVSMVECTFSQGLGPILQSQGLCPKDGVAPRVLHHPRACG